MPAIDFTVSQNKNVNYEDLMRAAIAEAAQSGDDVPVGALIVSAKGEVIAFGHNEREADHDPTAHAEIVAIRRAAKLRKDWRLEDCMLVVTLEPCVMCAGALYWSQIDKVVFGARDPKRGAGRYQSDLYHPKTLVNNGILEAECSALLVEFFLKKRK